MNLADEFEGMEEELELLWSTFRAETLEQLTVIENAIITLEADPGDHDAVATAFRAAHTIKGNARALAVAHVPELANAVEDVLEGLRGGTLALTADLVSLMLQNVDLQRQQVEADRAAPIPAEEETIALIKRLAEAIEAEAVDAEGAKVAEGLSKATTDVAIPQLESVDTSWAARNRTLRVGIEKLDSLLNLTGEIAIARGRLDQALEGAGGSDNEAIMEIHNQAGNLYMELQEMVMKVRMVPIGPFFQRYRRLVRDLVDISGKNARLVVYGGDVEVDTTIVEQLRDPITHMIRNAIDHGIETPDERAAAGKPAVAQVILRAFHETGSIVVEVEDDGAGINRKKVAKRAEAMGLVTSSERIEDKEICQLLLEPGFTTSEEVTELSGRGVGMDVVRRHIESLRGSVEVVSQESRGTRVTMCLPLTLAIIDGLSVQVGAETYILPLDTVKECADLQTNTKTSAIGLGTTDLRGEVLPFIRLRDIFKVNGTSPVRQTMVVVLHGEHRSGLVVDRVLGEGQVVIKPLGQLFQDLQWISGSAIQGNGRVAMILDVPALIQQTTNKAGGSAEHSADLTKGASL